MSCGVLWIKHGLCVCKFTWLFALFLQLRSILIHHWSNYSLPSDHSLSNDTELQFPQQSSWTFIQFVCSASSIKTIWNHSFTNMCGSVCAMNETCYNKYVYIASENIQQMDLSPCLPRLCLLLLLYIANPRPVIRTIKYGQSLYALNWWAAHNCSMPRAFFEIPSFFISVAAIVPLSTTSPCRLHCVPFYASPCHWPLQEKAWAPCCDALNSNNDPFPAAALKQ